ncbi:MAG: HNH endonuclease [Bryobacterales bacterium]|nr:HNH endonuclease [Bryobacteraceae bacterium]MDW8356187.1 HNH endonuclease [Bryobacterales bacterium]
MPDSSDSRLILEKIRQLNVWKRGEERAPHKPLLILLALGRVVRGEARMAPFPDIEQKLARLLEEFGPPRQSVHPEYPFWRLQHDGLWEVEGAGNLPRRSGDKEPLLSELRERRIPGGFPEEIDRAFRQNPRLVAEAALEILQNHFPESLHSEILGAVGLSHILLPEPQDRQILFREAVLDAYGHACALCGYDVRLGRADLGLGAAHIRWRPAGGPDHITNGLALCAVHHRAFDRGALSLDLDYRILVSNRLAGRTGLEEWFRSLAGRQARRPKDEALAPAPEHLRWHHEYVFWRSATPGDTIAGAARAGV